jgi:hypothetical protein
VDISRQKSYTEQKGLESMFFLYTRRKIIIRNHRQSLAIFGNLWQSIGNHWQSKQSGQSGQSKIQLFPPWENYNTYDAQQ